jgi:Flp pilus assembly protein TadG
MRLASMIAFLAATARVFRRDRRANVAMMFGLSLVPILVATGAGIDFARGMMVHQRMAAALDAAALAVGNATSKPSSCSSDAGAGGASNKACANLQALAQTYFNQNYDSSQNASYGTPTPVQIGIANQAVTLTSNLALKLTLMGIAPLDIGTQPTVGASSTVVWGQTKLWVALVLDNSGSMDKGDSGGSKMDALKDAINNTTYGLLNTLKAAAGTPGDVQVGMVPFTRSVNPGLSSTSTYIDWGEWEAPPANASTPGSNVGPGDACPWSTASYGYKCLSSSTNSTSTTSTIPSNGLICPSEDSGSKNPDHIDRYYNGCYTSVANSPVSSNGTPVTKTICSDKSSCTTDNYCGGYPAKNTSTSGHTTTVTTTSCSCSGKNSNKSCTTTAQPVITTITYAHAWKPNSHSTWSGCAMDRQQYNKSTKVSNGSGGATNRVAAIKDYDETNTLPTSNSTAWDDTQVPAENPESCIDSAIVPITQDWSGDAPWTNLTSKVKAMDAAGSTNQSIGMAHGWQMLTTGAPYGTAALPSGTTKVLILFSDGLNTQNRWVGDGSTEGTAADITIDTRMKATCTAAKADNVVIYAIFVHIGTNGSSDALSKCASDSTKYYDLTSSASIKDAFKDIAQKITNLRVAQ